MLTFPRLTKLINQNLKIMKKFLLAAGLALLIAGSTLHAQTGTYGGIDLLGSDITIQGDAEVTNACIQFPNTSVKTCTFNNLPLDPNWNISALPNSVASRYCVLRAAVSDICCGTSATAVAGMEVGGDADVMEIQWQWRVTNKHECEIFCPYTSEAEVTGEMTIDLSVSGPSGTFIPVWYDFTGFMGAISKPESGVEDFAQIDVTSVSLGGNDLHQAGNLPTNIQSSPLGFGGDWSDLALSGFLWVEANTTFQFTAVGTAEAFVNPDGEERTHWLCGLQWRENGSANYFGNLRLSTSGPLSSPTPATGTSPAHSYFSVDIGSASELSDPFASGTEYFDPGDAYRIQGPAMAPGGVDGTLDDAVFMGGIDFPPSTPDPAVPSATAAPVGAGVLPTTVIPQYLNIDGLARTDFDFTVPPPGGLPILTNPLLSDCVFAPKFLYLSFDDDRQGHYTDATPSVPANSTWSFGNTVFGSDSGKDEILEMFSLPPFLGGTTVAVGLASESDVHPNLAPNPLPLGPDPENDDVNALSMAYNAGCDKWFVSVDHEATGILPNGVQPDPGTIYRVTPGPAGLTPVAGPAELGIPLGTDVDAFEFVSLYQPSVSPQGPALAVLFSVDWDDPLTLNVDESGALDPGIIYGSYMNGFYFVYDSAGFNTNVDAISNLPNSLSNPAQVNTCVPYNFTSAPTGLTVSISGNTLSATWDAYPFATKCQVAANRIDQAGDRTFILNNVLPPASNSFTFTGSQIQSNQTYRVRVRCGCSTGNVSPFTSYVFVTAPTPGPASNGQPYLFSDENEDEPVLALYPNPADAFFTLHGADQISGKVHVRIFNALGQQVHSEVFDASELSSGRRISVSGLTRGMYTVQTEMPERTETLPLMITR